jgi:HPt (histidine-containing phosphotransfer) domain-containing protein
LFLADAAPPPPVSYDADTRAALRAELGDEALTELDQQFAADLIGICDELSASLKGRDMSALRTTLHTLRGAAANLGVATLVELSERLKTVAVNQGFGAACDSAGASLMAACAALQAQKPAAKAA